MKNHPPATEFLTNRGAPVHLHNVNLHTMPSVEPPITDGEDAPPIAASPIADAPPVAAGAAADDAASDEDSLSSEVSRRGDERALTSEALLRAVDGAVDVDEGADSNRNNAETETVATTQQQRQQRSNSGNNAATATTQQQRNSSNDATAAATTTTTTTQQQQRQIQQQTTL